MRIYMKKILLLFLTSLTLTQVATIQASQSSTSQKSYFLPITALFAGSAAALWVGKHWWDKYKLESAKKSFESNKKIKDDFSRGGGLEVSVALLASMGYSARKYELDNRFREQYKYPCLAFGAAG